MIFLLLGIMACILAGHGRAVYSLDSWHPEQLSPCLGKEVFPLIGSKVNNSFPLTMDFWHWHQFIFRWGLILGAFMMGLAAYLLIGIWWTWVGLLVAGIVEGNAFKWLFHNLLLIHPGFRPWRPWQELIVPYDLYRRKTV